ncbi:KpsF/GutQ family sugar-phosphate isomerase [Candidatus Poribacteria bacterium]|nr:KpsF/GutQ family sugar-phosphate isomerase [Candidatus Poribacteria bacterium]
MENSNDVLTRAKALIREEGNAILSLAEQLGESFIQAVNLIYECNGRVIITGMGKSGIIGKKIAATMSSTGTPAYFLHPAEGIHGDLGIVTHDDIVILISKSGDTEEINNLIPSMKLIGVKLIVITNNQNSILAKHSDVVLNLCMEKEACTLGLAPTTSTTMTLVLGDALAIALLDIKKFRAEDFAFFHPGGMLGRKLLLKVEELMHKDNAIPRVFENELLKEVLFEMTSKRLGMTTVINLLGELAGIITDGDLRRILEKNKNIFELKASEAMIINPKTIKKDDLAALALKKMEDFNITTLVVIDSSNKPIGIIHLHDIIKAGISS